jgi:ComF family protein
MYRFSLNKQLKPVIGGFQLFFNTLLEFIYPPLCQLCQNRLSHSENCICLNCWNQIPTLFCSLVEINLPGKQKVNFCRAYAVWDFNEQIQKVMHLFKYSGFTQLARPIAAQMVEIIYSDPDYSMADGLIPVPLHQVRQRERGYNQSQLLCDEISIISGIPVLAGNLQRVRNTETQTNLGALQRFSNVESAFKVFKPDLVNKKSIILVDDVLTTGSTLNACATELKKAGATKIMVLTAVRA